jgi:cell division protein FtsB
MNQTSNRHSLVLLLLIGGCLLFIVGYTGRLAEQARLQSEAVVWEGRIAAAQQRQAELSEQLAYVRSEAYVHQEAREALNLVMPGDELVVLVEGTAVPPAQRNVAGPSVTLVRPIPNWQQWLQLFLPPTDASGARP